jgi:hypothetical protein
MAYQEQVQLFRFDLNYFTDYLSKPGGFTEYLGTFLIQFYYYPKAGAFIITLIGIASYALTGHILKKYRISGVIFPYIPALIFFILLNDYLFNPGYIIDFFLVLIFFAIFISIQKNRTRYLFGFIGWTFLYIAAGGFSFLGTLFCIIHEILFAKKQYSIYTALAFALMALLIPYLSWRFLYLIPFKKAWSDTVISDYRNITKYAILLIFLYIPLLLLIIKIFPGSSEKTWLQSDWNWKSLLAAIIIIFSFSIVIEKYVYDSKLRLFFKIDYNVQHDGWDQVLKLTSQYTETNHLILYYINLALYKTGHLGDRMFHYSQIGIPGLWLNREGDEISLFLGGEFFYHLGDINEAHRWAFDAMIAKGQSSPRLLKQLVLTSIVNAELVTAEKYLNILDQSMFYRNWSKKHRNYLNNPDLLNRDPEIVAKRRLLIHNDFLATSDYSDISLRKLLENHPDNRMAFEYYMSSLLLDKDLVAFASNINRLKDFGYKEIPVHFEEALLLQINYMKQNLLPQGYGIRKNTIERFKSYADAYYSYTGKPEMAAQLFSRSFGNTYWFYLHFVNNQALSNESEHPFN